MQKVDFILFSKNRPMQLRALLESMFHFVDGSIINSIRVIFTFDPGYENGYAKVSSEFPAVIFVKENDFKGQTISILEQSIDHVCFLVDDIIFFRPVAGDVTPKSTDVCFSLRLGKNCKYSHPANSWYSLPSLHEEGNSITWDWAKGEYDFGYPFSLDGHIFRRDDILQSCGSSIFRSPNSLENSLVYWNPHMEKFKLMRMRAFHNSCLVGIPVNRVNNEVPNRFGLEFSITEPELQSIFDEGKRIAWEEMDFSAIQGPHKEIKFEFNTENSAFRLN